MRHLLLALLLGLLSSTAFAQPSFINFESGQVRPVAMSADGTRLFVTNTPDARLEIFSLETELPTQLGSVPVGLEPVAVAVESPERVWVVNHLSDSISIVDVASSVPRVVRTLMVGDEPRDIVFAGPGRRRAFITAAHRGQHAPYDRGQYSTEGVGRADVWVFDADELDESPTVLALFGDTPRALTVSADGTQVYAAVFLSGNRTTTVSEGAVCDGGPSAAPCNYGGTDYPGGLPAPYTNYAGATAPETGLIVRQAGDDMPWEDELGRDWSSAVRFELPDEDVFIINAMTSPPSRQGAYSGVGTVIYGMAAHPTSGDVFVANTEAHNEVRFEGPGVYVSESGLRDGQPPSVRGRLHLSRITRLAGDAVFHIPLNPHIDYSASPQPADARWRTIATPTSVSFSADGDTAFITALGSSSVAMIPTAELVAGEVTTDASRSIHLRDPWPGGPTGLVVDSERSRLYVMTRFDNSLTTVDLSSTSVVGRVHMHTPEPEATVVGRPVLYDALFSSSNGESSCASCHVFGDFDGLAWDLGDPDGDVAASPNPRGPVGGGQDFHPMKGPMTTQSLRGLADHGPMHWRGDRTAGSAGGDPLDEVGAFDAFIVAFPGLLGRDEGEIDSEDMSRFSAFATQIFYPPNPHRQLDNSLRPDEASGENIYFNTTGVDAIATCDGCHTLDRSRGFFGGDGRTTFENEPQHMKIAHLRNLYTKVGMFGMPQVEFVRNTLSSAPTGPQVRGFGFLHDGSIDTVERFFHASVFVRLTNGQDQRDLEAFMMAFDSNVPPIVGQQVTLADPRSDAQTLAANLLIQRAQADLVWPGGGTVKECDLVAHGVVGGEARGYVLQSDGRFHSDVAAEASLSPAELLALATGSNVLTLTCAPPGSGARMGIDRDEDGMLDGDDTEPALRTEHMIPNPDVGSMPPTGTDAGVDNPDGGADDAGVGDAGSGEDAATSNDASPPIGDDANTGTDASMMDGDDGDGGCGCRLGSRRSPTPLGLLLLVLFWRRATS